MSKHTPGPWDAIPDSGEDSEGDWYIVAPDEAVITLGLSQPDARLIAAAPDLLALLTELAWHPLVFVGCEDDEEFQALVMKARAAIAKAEGVS